MLCWFCQVFFPLVKTHLFEGNCTAKFRACLFAMFEFQKFFFLAEVLKVNVLHYDT